MIKGILFDFDGTLSYRVESAYYMYRYVAHQMFPEMDPDSIEFEARIQRMLLWDEFGTINKLHPFRMAVEKWGGKLTAEECVKIWRANFHEYQVAMPDMYRVLGELKKHYQLGAVSNGGATMQNPKIDVLDVRKYFEFVMVSGEVGVDKPDIRIFQQAADRLGLKMEEIAFIGDTFDTDILGAKKAGMLPIWYCYEHRCVTMHDIQMISSYKDIEHMFLEDTSWNK